VNPGITFQKGPRGKLQVAAKPQHIVGIEEMIQVMAAGVEARDFGMTGEIEPMIHFNGRQVGFHDGYSYHFWRRCQPPSDPIIKIVFIRTKPHMWGVFQVF
jgi:hypothetical protein